MHLQSTYSQPSKIEQLRSLSKQRDMVNLQFSGTRHLVLILYSKVTFALISLFFAWFSNTNLDDCRIFIVPANVVDRDVLDSHKHWHSYKRRDGTPRKDSGHVSINWDGKDTDTNIS